MNTDSYIDLLKKGYFPKGRSGPNGKLRVRKSLASEHNISLILKFVNERNIMSKWKSKDTMKNYIFNLHRLAEFLKNKKFEEVNKDVIISYIDYLMKFINKKTDKELKKITIEVAKSRIKSFFRWLYNGECPSFLKDMKVNLKPITVTPDQILTEEEIKKLIQVADNARDKAVVAVLYESGCRISEFLNIRLKNIKFDDYGAIINVSGKTGERSIRLVNSVPYLKEWLRYHPDKKEENGVWVSMHDKNVSKLNYIGVWFILKELAIKAGLTKNVRPHIIRHSRITHTASKLPESALRMMYGWTAGSDMPKVYIHLNGNDVDEFVLSRLYGKNIGNAKERGSLIEPKVCYSCGEVNPSDYEFCSKCKLPLDIEAIKLGEKRFLLPIIQKMIDRRMEEHRIKKVG